MNEEIKALVAEYSKLYLKLDFGVIEAKEFHRLGDIEDTLVCIYKFTWDQVFDAQFGVEHLEKNWDRVYP